MIFGVFFPRQILPRVKIKNMPLGKVEYRENTLFKRNPIKIGQKLKRLGQNLFLADMKNTKCFKNVMF